MLVQDILVLLFLGIGRIIASSRDQQSCPGGPPYVTRHVAALCQGHFPVKDDNEFPRWVVYFYGRDCRRCAELMVLLADAASRAPAVDRGRIVGKRKSRPALLFGSVDCHHARNQKLCKDHGVWKLPVLRALSRGVNFGETFEPKRIYEWAASHVSLTRPLPPSIQGQVPFCPAHELYDEPLLAQAFLHAHNVYRCVSGLKLLTWDTALWKTARSWARKAPADRLQHSPDAQRLGPGRVVCGENVANSYQGYLRPGQVVARWYAEMRNTDDGRIVGRVKDGVGHYTQLVWRKTERVGCSLEQAGQVAVCHYFPPGNEKGKYFTQVAPPLSGYLGIRGEERCGGPVEDIIVRPASDEDGDG